jgi:hypothetical protein
MIFVLRRFDKSDIYSSLNDGRMKSLVRADGIRSIANYVHGYTEYDVSNESASNLILRGMK